MGHFYLTQREAAGLGDQKGFFEEVLEMGERELMDGEERESWMRIEMI